MARKRSVFGRVFERKGRPGFYVRIRRKGVESERWAGPDRRTATEFLHDTLRKVSRETLLGDRAVPSELVSALEAPLLRQMEGKHGETTLRPNLPRVRRIMAHFGEMIARDVTADHIAEFIDGLKPERARDPDRKATAATKNRYLSVLSLLFDLAVSRGVARDNPVRDVARMREPRKAIPFVTDADVDRIAGQPWDAREAAIIRLLADAGLRRSEAARLAWEDVNLARGVVVVKVAKGKKPREVPLTSAASKALRSIRTKDAAGPVWPEYADESDLNRLSDRFAIYARRAGVAISLHGLRHGFCSRLAQAGVPLPTIAALAGHESIETTMRYAGHLPGGATFDAIRRLEKGGQPGGQTKRRPGKKANTA